MRPIKESTYNAIKSRSMIGNNRFNHKILVEGEPVGYSGIVGERLNKVYSTGYGWSLDFCETTNGKVFTLLGDVSKVYCKILDRTEFESTPLSVANGTHVFTYSTKAHYKKVSARPFSLLRLRSGKILILMCDFDFSIGRQRVLLFKSEDGTGSDIDWSSRVVLYEYQYGSSLYTDYEARYGLGGIEAQDGTIFMINSGSGQGSGYLRSHARCFVSNDGGTTWANYYIGGQNLRLERTARLLYLEKQNILAYTSNNYSFGAWPAAVYYSLDKGQTWANSNTSGFEPAFIQSGGYVYAHSTNGNLYRSPSDEITVATLLNVSGWELYKANAIYPAGSGGQGKDWGINQFKDGTIVLQSGNAPGTGNMYITSLYREFLDSNFKAQSIAISKSNGGASTATVVVDNKGGVVNPRNTDGPLYGILNLNKEVKIQQGYGDDLVDSFTGMIDGIAMSTFPQLATVSLRDNFKKALDQTVTKAGQMVVNYPKQPIEDIVTDLCSLCGLPIGQIDPTGISIEKEFNWESYADAFQFLSDIASFEYLVDESGKFNFRRDYQPSNAFVAWSFEEGIDISGLTYTIADNDLYKSVRVYGKSGDTDIVYNAPFLDAAQFNLLPQKVLKIDATETSTTAELRKIAERAMATMRSRTRIIEFSSIAVPHLQVGDFIQLFESSTDTHEIYRLTSINLTMTEKNFTMQCKAYYYGDSIVPGELPTDTATQTPSPTLNLIPEMTSNTTPSGVARSSSVYKDWAATYSPWRAFNGDDQDYFWDLNTKQGWLEYEFPQKTIVDKYTIRARETILYNKAVPKDWTFQAFDGEKWITLDTRTNQTSWGIYEERSYLFANTMAYAKYRLNVTANNGYVRTQLERLKMYYGGGA